MKLTLTAPLGKSWPLPPSRVTQVGATVYYTWNIVEDTLLLPWPNRVEEPLVTTGDIRVHYDHGPVYREWELWEAFHRRSPLQPYLQGNPDPMLTQLMAAVIVGNKISDGHVWLHATGNASTGKTTTANYFRRLQEYRLIRYIHKFTPANILHRNHKLSIVDGVVKGGTLICRDFSSLLANGFQSYKRFMSIMREIYDGEYEIMHYSQQIRWRGKIGLILLGTPISQMWRKSTVDFGERFLHYRMNYMDRPDIRKETGIADYLLKLQLPRSIADIACVDDTAIDALSKLSCLSRMMTRRIDHWRRIHEQLRSIAAAIAVINGKTVIDSDVLRNLLQITLRGVGTEFLYLLECVLRYGINEEVIIAKKYLQGKYQMMRPLNRLLKYRILRRDNGRLIPGTLLAPIAKHVPIPFQPRQYMP